MLTQPELILISRSTLGISHRALSHLPTPDSELDLLLAVGNYWGYLYVTVDGKPANLLPAIPGNLNSHGQPAGYKTLYEPEKQGSDQPVTRWVRVHRARGQDGTTAQSHQVNIELWRGWGQIPLRAVAVDSLPPQPFPIWPGIALIISGLWSGYLALSQSWRPWSALSHSAHHGHNQLTASLRLLWPLWPQRVRLSMATGALLAIGIGAVQHWWFMALTGVVALAYDAVPQPAIWTAALLFALPFYYALALPLLPNHVFSIIDTGVFVGILVVITNRFLYAQQTPLRTPNEPTSNGREIVATSGQTRFQARTWFEILLAAIVSWSLVSAMAADQRPVAIHEWRTVFFAAGLFAVLLAASIGPNHIPDDPLKHTGPEDHAWLLIGAWLAGATLMALIGLWQYGAGVMLITAEGVHRVRALYGSPNNLALYLERTLTLGLALTFFLPNVKQRLGWGLLIVPQAVALFLTFSKGSLLLGLPTGLATLWLGGMVLRRQYPHGAARVVVGSRGRAAGRAGADPFPRHRTLSASFRLQPRHRFLTSSTLA